MSLGFNIQLVTQSNKTSSQIGLTISDFRMILIRINFKDHS